MFKAKKRKQNPKPHRSMTVFVIGIFTLSLLFLFSQLHLSHYFPIKIVRVFGANHVDRKEVEELLLPLVKKGFFSVDLEEIHDKLSEMSWISSIVIKRVWPDQLEIELFEKKPIAKWNNGDLLTEKGELFLPQKDSAPITDLVELFGPPGKQNIIFDFYNEMNRLLEPLQVRISKLELTPYYTWNIELSNHIKLQVGYQNAVYRMLRFVKVFPKIVGDRGREVNYIDLRYSNGMAVRWKNNGQDYG